MSSFLEIPHSALEEVKILIVDDDEIDQMVIRRSLSKTSLQTKIYTASTAKEGIQFLKSHTFDCIFVDFMLPEMNGLELLEQLNELGISVPVLIVTSHGDERIAAKAIQLGAADYIPKSLLTPEGVYHSIRNAIRLHQAKTEKQQAEERLVATQSQLELLITNTPTAFWSTDAEGRFLYAMGMAYELIGVNPAIIVGKTFYEIFNPYPRIIQRFQRALSGEVVQSVDESNKHYFKSHYVPAFDEKGKITGVTGFAIDITDRVINERELVKAKEVAENSVRVKEQFLANISHEIRTPMNGIIGLANVLKKTELKDEQKKYLNAIRKSADNLMQIINDLLDFSKITSNKFTFEEVDFDLVELVQDVVDLMEVKANERQNRLTTYIDRSVPVNISGDPLRLRQVLLNLVGNAIKFTESGDIKILIHTTDTTPGKIVLEFTVEDTGIGIPEEKLHSVFESFNQGSNDTTRKYGGTGLGLTIAKNIVEMQGGTIAVRSQPLVGSAFTFSLPFQSVNEPHISEVDSSTEDEALLNKLAGIKALLAEDNEINLLLINTVLADWGVETDSVENGLEALESLSKHDYDIILMDMQMPEMDGYEAITRIRNSDTDYAKSPIIALTAHASEEEISKCLAVGANAYVAKPFDPNELFKTIVKLLGPSGKYKGVSVNMSVLRSMAGENPDFLSEVLKMYIDTTPKAVKQLHKLIEQEHLDDARKRLAELYDSVSVIAAKPLQFTFQHMADALSIKNVSLLKSTSEQAVKECDELVELLQQEYNRVHDKV